MNQLLIDFERHIALGPTYAAKLLGYPYSTYAQYRSTRRPVKPNLRRSVQAMMLLPRSALDAMIREHVYG